MAAASQSVRLTRATVACVIDYGPLLSVAYKNVTCRRAVVRRHQALLGAIGDGDRVHAGRAVRQAGVEVALELARRKTGTKVAK